jgi:hypothetical protein
LYAESENELLMKENMKKQSDHESSAPEAKFSHVLHFGCPPSGESVSHRSFDPVHSLVFINSALYPVALFDCSLIVEVWSQDAPANEQNDR